MNFADAIKHLKLGEQALLNQLATESGYRVKYECLDLSSQISSIVKRLELLAEDETNKPKTENNPKRYDAGREEAGLVSDYSFPEYFISENKLWKIAEKSSGSGALYRKSFPVEDLGGHHRRNLRGR